MEFKADPKVWKTLSFAHMTEKSINLIEKENKLAFIVNLKSNKKQVKDAFQKAFDVKIDKVNILIDQKGRKKAFVKLNKDYAAADVAMKLGIM
jgi:ribosomal protein uL23